MSNPQVIEINAENMEQKDAMLVVGQTRRYHSFKDFLYSPDCPKGVPITDIDTIKPRPAASLEPFSNLQKAKREQDFLIRKNEEIAKATADVIAKRQGIMKSVMKAKTDKEAILSSIADIPTEAETKKLGELSISIEVLQRQAEKLVSEEHTLQRQKAKDEDFKAANEACIAAEKAFLQAIAGELTHFLFASKELKWLWAVYTKTTSKTFLRDILKDCFAPSKPSLEYDPRELEAVIKDIFTFYESSFGKEGK